MPKAIVEGVKDAADFVMDTVVAPVIGFATDVFSSITKALSPDIPSNGLANRNVMINSPIADQKIIVGRARTAGNLLYAEVTNNNQDLHLIIGIASNEIEYNTMYIGDTVLVGGIRYGDVYDTYFDIEDYTATSHDSSYDNYMSFLFATGRENQSLNANIINNTSLTTDDDFKGIAYVYIKLKYNASLYPSGIPEFNFHVEGDAHQFLDESFTRPLDRVPTALYHYMTNTRYGLGIDDTEIDFDSFSKCFSGDAVTHGFWCDGIINLSSTAKSTIEDLLSANSASLTYSNGKFKMVPYESDSTPESYRVRNTIPSMVITPSNIVGAINMSTEAPQDKKYNTTQAVYIEPNRSYQAYESPELQYASFLAEDNGVESKLDVTLPFTIDDLKAQEIAFIAMATSRRKISMTISVDMRGCFVDVGDYIMLDLTSIGFPEASPTEPAHLFEVVSWQLEPTTEGTTVRLGLLSGKRSIDDLTNIPYDPVT